MERKNCISGSGSMSFVISLTGPVYLQICWKVASLGVSLVGVTLGEVVSNDTQCWVKVMLRRWVFFVLVPLTL